MIIDNGKITYAENEKNPGEVTVSAKEVVWHQTMY